MGFVRQEHWSGLPCSSPEGLLYPEIEPASLMSPTLAGGLLTTSATWEAPYEVGCAGEGHGNPLQCSCLENPMDRRAW